MMIWGPLSHTGWKTIAWVIEGEEMTKPYPTARQREVLQLLMSGDWVPILRRIPVGERLLATLLRTGWVERTNDLYRITEAGRTAFKTRVPIR